ncbi:MAG: hypothetical protein L0216_17245 [Planctomycetales bacterium]|nr:hypothetical protein [Planctomycetales bacterium]
MILPGREDGFALFVGERARALEIVSALRGGGIAGEISGTVAAFDAPAGFTRSPGAVEVRVPPEDAEQALAVLQAAGLAE